MRRIRCRPCAQVLPVKYMCWGGGHFRKAFANFLMVPNGFTGFRLVGCGFGGYMGGSWVWRLFGWSMGMTGAVSLDLNLLGG